MSEQTSAIPMQPPAARVSETQRLLTRDHTRFMTLCAGLLIVAPLLVMWAASQGAMSLSLEALWQSITGTDNTDANLQMKVMWEIRLPRVLMSLITGAGLAISGAVMQGICRNPLADPGLIGVSSGAALFAAVVMVFGGAMGLPAVLQPLLLPIAAFTGALVVSMLVFRLARTTSGINTLLLILAGVAINALVGTLMGLLAYVADDGTLRLITFWSMGSYAGANWQQVGLVALGVGLPATLMWRYKTELTLMLSGEQEAKYLGVPGQKVKSYSLFAVALLTACCVCFTGIVGFVGLVTPHICRMVVGPDLRKLLPLSALTGAFLVGSADTLARTLIIPSELPVGIVTSCLGVPFFLYLLLRERKGQYHV